MDMTIKTPTQILVNGKFLCLADEVYIGEKKLEPKEGITPQTFTGTIVDIRKKQPRTKEEKEKSKNEAKSVETYDEFFQRMRHDIDQHIKL